MKNILYITGHKHPDTDSICSAIAYAEFKNRTGKMNAIPIRLGEVNEESKFALDYFGVEAPTLIENVKVQVSDLNIDTTAPISPDISLKMAWNIMKKSNIKTLPVIDDDNKLLGIVSLSNLTSVYMDIWDTNIFSKSGTTLENILDTLSGDCIYMHGNDSKFTGKVVITAMEPTTASEFIENDDIVICGDREDTQIEIINCNASLMIITGNHTPTNSVIEHAKNKGCTLITTPYDSFTCSRLIIQSIPISYVMIKDNVMKFRTDDFLDDIKDIMLNTRYRSYPVVDKNNHVLGTLSRYHLISHNKKQVILVDHNEKTQSVEGIEHAKVLEIIDHHRIADIQTGLPIYFRNEPLGSTATIIASIFFENGIRPSKRTAGLLCSAIISDTLLFKSPTSTNVDKLMLKRLAEIANINIDTYAKDMFKAGTSLKGKTVNELLHQDFKIFNLDDYKVGISQIGTMDVDSFSPMRNEMLEQMKIETKNENFDLLIFMLTDILNDGSEFFVIGENKDIISKAFNVNFESDSIYMPGILSRKKQVVPPISEAIASIKS